VFGYFGVFWHLGAAAARTKCSLKWRFMTRNYEKESIRPQRQHPHTQIHTLNGGHLYTTHSRTHILKYLLPCGKNLA